MLIRNKTIIKRVQIRDLGLCRCCGFKGSEAHHVIPLVYGGQDNVRNIVWVCYYCHKNAPDTKQKFYDYMMDGGARIPAIYGRIIIELEKAKMDFHIYFPQQKEMIKSLREIDRVNCFERYNLKESLEVPDVDFSIERGEWKRNTNIVSLRCQ